MSAASFFDFRQAMGYPKSSPRWLPSIWVLSLGLRSRNHLLNRDRDKAGYQSRKPVSYTSWGLCWCRFLPLVGNGAEASGTHIRRNHNRHKSLSFFFSPEERTAAGGGLCSPPRAGRGKKKHGTLHNHPLNRPGITGGSD